VPLMNEFLAALPVPKGLEGLRDRAAREHRPIQRDYARQVTATREPMPSGVARPTRFHAVTVSRAAQREADRRERVTGRKGGVPMSASMCAAARAWIAHPDTVGLASLPRAEAQALRVHLRRMGRSTHSQRGRRLIGLYCVVRAFASQAGTGEQVVAGLGVGALASLFRSDRDASAHVGRHAIRAKYHRADRARLASGHGDPAAGNCGLIDELELAGLLRAFQPAAGSAPRWCLGSKGFPFLAVVVLPVGDDPPS